MVLFLVRYGELALKSRPVRARFEQALVRNLRRALGPGASVSRGFGRIFVQAPPGSEATIARVFGVVSVSPVTTARATLEDITAAALSLAGEIRGTFAVKARRVGTHPFTSQQVNETVGAAIAALGHRVNLSSPETTLWIEVRDQRAYLFTRKVPGPGGFPLGTQGRVLCLLEQEQDLLACWLFMKKGCLPVLWLGQTQDHPSEKPASSLPGRAQEDPSAKPASLHDYNLAQWVQAGIAALEFWAFRSLPLSHGTLEKVVEQERPLGIVTSRLENLALRGRLGLPIYTPLLGMRESQRSRLRVMLNQGIATSTA